MTRCGHCLNTGNCCLYIDMTVPFVKMHGLGNDYVYIDCFRTETAAQIAQLDIQALARRISDRHMGVGSDGLVLMLPTPDAEVKMRMFNADGSEAEMCGNAARCIAKYAYEQGLCGNPMTLETLSGIKRISLQTNTDGKVEQATVEMGTTLGNPHKVFFVDESEELDSRFECLLTGPEYAELRAHTNIECVYVINNNELRMRVCERGTGETMACGTGACAAAMAAMDKGLTGSQVTVHLRGGDLQVRRDERGMIYLIGTATEVFRGEYMMED